MILWCPCGTPHESSFFLDKTIEERGRDLTVVAPTGKVAEERAWLVPRIFVHVHGLDIDRIEHLAKQYNLTEVKLEVTQSTKRAGRLVKGNMDASNRNPSPARTVPGRTGSEGKIPQRQPAKDYLGRGGRGRSRRAG